MWVHRDREDHGEEEHRSPRVEEALALEAEEAGPEALLEDQPGDTERGGGGQQAGQGAEQRTGRVIGADHLSHDPEGRARVERLHDPEGGGTGDLVAGWYAIDVVSYDRAVELAAYVSSEPGPGGKPLYEWIQIRQIMEAPPSYAE